MAFAEVDSEIPLGIEAVTGLRTDYVHRGFQLAESALDFQLEAEIILSNNNSLSLGFAHLSESGGVFSLPFPRKGEGPNPLWIRAFNRI